MMLSIIAGLDALPLLAPPGAVAWRPLIGSCPPLPCATWPEPPCTWTPVRSPGTTALKRRAWDTLNYPSAKEGKDVREFIGSCIRLWSLDACGSMLSNGAGTWRAALEPWP